MRKKDISLSIPLRLLSYERTYEQQYVSLDICGEYSEKICVVCIHFCTPKKAVRLHLHLNIWQTALHMAQQTKEYYGIYLIFCDGMVENSDNRWKITE